jgi:hypothetical protein
MSEWHFSQTLKEQTERQKDRQTHRQIEGHVENVYSLFRSMSRIQCCYCSHVPLGSIEQKLAEKGRKGLKGSERRVNPVT